MVRFVTKLAVISCALFATGCTSHSLSTDDQPSDATFISQNDNLTEPDDQSPIIIKSAASKEFEDVSYTQDSNYDVAALPSIGGVYAQIANMVRANNVFPNQFLQRGKEHELEAHKLSLLPQFAVEASLNEDGDPLAGVSMQQTLFDSGSHKAQRVVLESEQSEIEAQLKLDEAERIKRALDAYVGYYQAVEKQALAQDISKRFYDLKKSSQHRLEYGVGAAADRDLFDLKRLEAEAEYEAQRSEAESNERELKIHTGKSIPKIKPTPIELPVTHAMPASVNLAAAKVSRSLANVDFEKARSKPQVSLIANALTPIESKTSEEEYNLKLALRQELNWGSGQQIAASLSAAEANQAEYEETIKNYNDRSNLLKHEIRQTKLRIKRLSKVTNSAKSRLKTFKEQFSSGQVGLVESVGILDSYKKIKSSQIDEKYKLLFLQIEAAYLSNLI